MACAGALLMLSCLSVYVNPAKAWLLVPLEILFWPLTLLNILLLIWALLRRSKAFLIPLVALIPSFLVLGRFVQFGKPAAPEGETLKIVSYNVGRFRSYPDRLDSRACMDSVFRFLRESDADVICLQEFYLPNDGSSVNGIISRRMRGWHITSRTYTGLKGRFGNVTLSRYEPVRKGCMDFDSSANLAVWADYLIDGRMLRVYNCHLESYNISPAGLANAVFGKEGNKGLEETGRRVRKSIRQRSQQVDRIFKDIYASPVESVICGDFNDSPLSYTYQKTVRGHLDSFREAGRGLGASFPSRLPVIRLDYILPPDDMTVCSYSCPAVDYSDHRPVISEITFKQSSDSR